MIPMTQGEIKFARNLNNQKYRKEFNTYLIEGDKIVKEWLASSIELQQLICTEDWYHTHLEILSNTIDEKKIRVVPSYILEKISAHKTAPAVMAIVPMPSPVTHPFPTEAQWHIVLDRIQDPGNMGTIIRIADWFGIASIICSPGCVEIYNPKVIQSCMGSILRVNIHHMEIAELIEKAQLPIWAATLEGTSIYNLPTTVEQGGYLIMGNESQGIDTKILSRIQNFVTIPRFGGAESLNVGVATGILCSHLCK